MENVDFRYDLGVAFLCLGVWHTAHARCSSMRFTYVHVRQRQPVLSTLFVRSGERGIMDIRVRWRFLVGGGEESNTVALRPLERGMSVVVVVIVVAASTCPDARRFVVWTNMSRVKRCCPGGSGGADPLKLDMRIPNRRMRTGSSARSNLDACR